MSKDTVEIVSASRLGWLMGLVYFLFLQITSRYEPLVELLGDNFAHFYLVTTVVFIIAMFAYGRKKEVFVLNRESRFKQSEVN